MAYNIDTLAEFQQLTCAEGVSEPLQEEVEECLLSRSLCTLMSMGQYNLPKTRAKLENALRPCTAVVPYANALDVLADVNQSSTQPIPSVSVHHAKKRVYVELKTLKEEHAKKYRTWKKCEFATQQSQIEDMIWKRIAAWLHSDPEGTEEELISGLVSRCKIKITIRSITIVKRYTAAPSRLLAMNKKHLKHKRAIVKKKGEGSSKNEDSAPETRMTTVFAIGVMPGENQTREIIKVNPEGVTGIEVDVRGGGQESTGYEVKKLKRLRAVGLSKAFSVILRNRLTYTVRDRNAILIPATQKEKDEMIFKVAEWVARKSSEAPHPLAQLQQELINICVGKLRNLTPSTLTDLLQKNGFITIDDEQSVTYQLPTERHKKLSWQEDTVKTAVTAKGSNCKGMLKKAFPQKKGKGVTRKWDDISDQDMIDAGI